MKLIIEQERTEGVILVDACNAFNPLNRKTALHSIRIICAEFSTVLINAYRLLVHVFILSGGEIYSVEGTTRSDNLVMSFYALGTSILLNRLKLTSPTTNQVSLAYDIAGTGKILDLRIWWDTVISEGKNFGYYVNESKRWLIIKNPNHLDHAQNIFKYTGIKFTCKGKRHLRAVIGSDDFKSEYVHEKITNWIQEIIKFTEYA